VSYDASIPGYHTISDWPVTLQEPVRISNCGRYRDGGPRGGTYYVDLEDKACQRHPFFFDNFLGRLCYGNCPDDEDAAFLMRGSAIERDVFAILESLTKNSEEFEDVYEHLKHARTWTDV
jgi:hypothetical protein